MNSFYTAEELNQLGLKSIGNNVLLSKKTSIYGISRISIGSNVRIDDFCVLSAGTGGITIGNYVHIAVFSSIMGEGSILISDFSGISSRVAIYSSNDDYSGLFMTNPTVPSIYTNVKQADKIIKKHAIIGSGSIILPGVTLGTGVAIGALSFVHKNCKPFTVYSGNPARIIGPRSEQLIELENKFKKELIDNE